MDRAEFMRESRAETIELKAYLELILASIDPNPDVVYRRGALNDILRHAIDILEEMFPDWYQKTKTWIH